MRSFRVLACLMLSLTTVAAGQDSVAASVMDGYDADKDGKLSFYELLDHFGENLEGFESWKEGFRVADSDKDMHLTMDELTSLLERVGATEREKIVDDSEESVAISIMDGLDIDKDGKLSMYELLDHVKDDKEKQEAFAGWTQGFKNADSDKDGHLTVKELVSLLKATSRKDQHKLVQESEDEVAASIMDGFDADKNGEISLSELLDRVGAKTAADPSFGGWTKGFKEADSDKNGQLNVQELSSLLQRVSRKHQNNMVEQSEMELAASVMDGFDADKDGEISLQELLDHIGDDKELHAAFKGWRQGFDEADSDKNGHLNIMELASLLHRVSRKDQHKLVEESEMGVAETVMNGFDTDRNGKISLRELLDRVGNSQELNAAFAGWERGFVEADEDGDGQLSSKELKALLQRVSRKDQKQLVKSSELEVATTIMDGFDSNRDGKLSMQELLDRAGATKESQASFPGWQQGFFQADVDDDGRLDVEELSALLQRVSKNAQNSMIEQSQLEVAESVMDGFDADKNGEISLQELLNHIGDDKELQAAFKGWRQGFEEADTDKNGQLSIKELASLLQRVSRQDQHKLVEESEMSVAATVMDGFDADRNGKISLRELLDRVGDSQAVNAAFAGWEHGFMEADVDRDGQLSLEELAALLQRVSRKDQSSMVEQSEIELASSVMDGFDADKNGEISLKELLDHIGDDKELLAAFKGWRQGFEEADTDKNGQLNIKELASLLHRVSRQDQHKLVEESEKGVAETVMDGFDADRNGKISLQELLDRVGDSQEVNAAFAGWKKGFLEADEDRDGQLSLKELAALLQRVSRTGQHDMVEHSESGVAERIMQGLDGDSDGRISLMEMLDHIDSNQALAAAAEQWREGFRIADVDKDMHLDKDELADLVQRVSRDEQKHLVERSEESTTASILGELDLDGDNKLSLKELVARVGDNAEVNAAFAGWKQGFLDADADKDGYLTAKELELLLKRVSTRDQNKLVENVAATTVSLLQRLDVDKDGKVSMSEIVNSNPASPPKGGWAEGFLQADADRDGGLNAHELAALFEYINAKHAKDEM